MSHSSDSEFLDETRSIAQPSLGGLDESCLVGRGLGGSSRINAMIYTRGLPAEYNAWRDAGRVGWGWEDLQPLFVKGERASGGATTNLVDHGTEGTNECMKPPVRELTQTSRRMEYLPGR